MCCLSVMHRVGLACFCHFSALDFVPQGNLATVCQARGSRLGAQMCAPSRGEEGSRSDSLFAHTDQDIRMGKLEGRLGFFYTDPEKQLMTEDESPAVLHW